MSSSSIFRNAVARALADQKWWQRYKNSLTDVAGTVLQLANLALAFTADGPIWINVLIGVLIGLAQITIQAGTLGPITPSMANRLAQASEQAQAKIEPAPAPAPAPAPDAPGTALLEHMRDMIAQNRG